MSESVLAASDFSLETSWKQAEKGTLSPFECLSFANTIQADLPTCALKYLLILLQKLQISNNGPLQYNTPSSGRINFTYVSNLIIKPFFCEIINYNLIQNDLANGNLIYIVQRISICILVYYRLGERSTATFQRIPNLWRAGEQCEHKFRDSALFPQSFTILGSPAIDLSARGIKKTNFLQLY